MTTPRRISPKNGEVYDVIFDAVGKTSFAHCEGSLKDDGTYLTVDGGIPLLLHMLWTSKFGSKKVIAGTAEGNTEDLIFLRELIEAGKLVAVIDRRYPLEKTAEAHRYVDKGYKTGNVVITVTHNDSN